MLKKSLKLVVLSAVLPVLLLSACGMFGSKVDEEKDIAASQLYKLAREDMDDGKYESAVTHFQKLESRYPFGVYAQQAQLEIAYAQYRQGNKEDAIASADRFIKLHPNHPHVDYAYYLRGLINFNDQVSFFDFVSHQDPSERDPKGARESFDAFKQLVDKFPDSIYTPDAIGRMKYLVIALAKYDVHVARYYFRRGAYVAAANRAQAAVKNYQETPSIEEALFIMMKSYEMLNMPDLRNDAERVLKQNFPNSAFLNANNKHDKAAWWKVW